MNESNVMTKSQEVAALRNFALSLPCDSYLRPWLESVIPQVESEIKADFFPSPSIGETRKFCQAEIAEARKQADSIKSSAVEQARKHIAEANSRYDRITGSIYEAIRGCQRSLESC